MIHNYEKSKIKKTLAYLVTYLCVFSTWVIWQYEQNYLHQHYTYTPYFNTIHNLMG